MIDELRTLISIVSQYEHLSFRGLAATMVVAVGCGFLIYLLYRFFYRGMLYSDNFGVLIVMVAGTTAFIVVTIGANLVLSLGMVGALSIIRFRAAIKEPLDVGFLFLAVAAGLASGARLYLVAIIGTVALGLTYIVLCSLRKDKRNFLLILRYQADQDAKIIEMIKTIRHKLKNKTYSNDTVELTVEVNVKNNQTEFMESFTSSEFISSAVLVEYNGDYT
ncbi:MAG: DUF4956 domain-containing protein [Oscillospiraceae bacterium]|jgi:hypothetical protein|nr:DUF4956 domain-containing protein [Oscillospiraceae bacterium]